MSNDFSYNIEPISNGFLVKNETWNNEAGNWNRVYNYAPDWAGVLEFLKDNPIPK